MSAEPAAKKLRESFGDRKIPDISRKITACVACRRLKIKCHMTESKPPCTRCKSRGLSCTINKSLQMLLENDATWKDEVESRLRKIESSLTGNLNSTDVRVLPNSSTEASQHEWVEISAHSKNIVSPGSDQTQDSTAETVLDLGVSLGAFPASSLRSPEQTSTTSPTNLTPDLITRGVLSIQSAERLLGFYQQHLDSYIHFMLDEDDKLEKLRERSSILTAAICAAAALCSGSVEYQSCLDAFTQEVSSKVFAKEYCFDDVRAMCIGSLWLVDMSSALNGLAVRIATQLQLHRCLTKMPHTVHACYVRTKLFFQVYLVDHIGSLVYGRPPMTHEWRSLNAPGTFLQSKFSNRRDLNLIGQVELWSITRRVFARFGADVQSDMASQRSADLRYMSQAYDNWRQDWIDVIAPEDDHLHTRQVFDLYYHAAKLYLFSHVFRGPSNPKSPAALNSTDSLAQQAFDNATAITQAIVDTNDAHGLLESIPYYLSIMISFSCVCIIQMARDGQTVDDHRRNEGLRLLTQLPGVLRTSLQARPAHPLMSVAKSLELAANDRDQDSGITQAMSMEETLPDFDFNFELFGQDSLNWNLPGFDDKWMLCPDDFNSPDFQFQGM